jgi:hypothetical protein
MRDAELDTSLDRASDSLDALAMTFGARQSAFGSPAAIAIHDDGDMTGGRSIGSLPGELIHRKSHVRLLQFG